MALAEPNVYERRDRLGLKFESRGNRSYATADQIDQLDALHDHIKQGNTIDSFVESLSTPGGSLVVPEQTALTAALLALASATQRQPEPLAHFKALQEASDRGWLLPGRELAPLLGLSRVSGKVINRFGFICTRTGRWWRITREVE